MGELALRSKKINKLKEYIERKDTLKIAEFWKEIEELRSPIIEEIEGDNDNVLLTFLYKGDEETNNVLIFGGFIEYIPDNYDNNVMKQILDSNIWYRTFKVRNDIKCNYSISVNFLVDGVRSEKVSYIDDPLGTQRIVIPKDDEHPEEGNLTCNIIELPNSLKDYWTIPKENVPKGNVEMLRMKNESLNVEHRVWVYTPNGYSKENDPYKVLVLSDGYSYVVSTPTLLDNLIHENKIPPTVAVFIECEEKRNDVLRCDEDFAEFTVNKVLKECREKYNISNKSEDNIIGGLSLGGLFASYLGLNYSKVFGNVLSQSGSYWWYPGYKWGELIEEVNYDKIEWMAENYVAKEKLGLKFYIEVGTLEGPLMMKGSKDMRDVLLSKGCSVEYLEFQGGHDYLSWKETLAKGLIFLISE